MYDGVGKKIRAYRKLKHLTQKELANYLEVPIGYLGGIERGTKQADLAFIQKVSEFLQVSVDDLMAESSY